MKKTVSVILLFVIITLSFIGCQGENTKSIPENESENVSSIENDSSNISSTAKNGFEMNVFSDKRVYKTTEKINIGATLKYVGNEKTVKIWHGDPYMMFSITDGKDFNTEAISKTILTSTVLDKDKLYNFEYKKNGGWDANDPKADFWEKFYGEPDLLLPQGEYTVTLCGDFSLSENLENKSDLICELKIKVIY